MLHEEIKAMQVHYGIGYKDAAHRLFMAEVERLKKCDTAARSFATVRDRIDYVMESEIYGPIKAIDNGNFDGFKWNNGRWETKED